MTQLTETDAAPKLKPAFVEPCNSYAEIKAQQIAKAGISSPSAFKVRAQLLERGRTDAVLAASKHLTLRLKVYASGGENVLHAHMNEDHFFVILDGTADFYGEDGLMARLGKYEGIMLPQGSRYSFMATSKEPLVMLRAGSPNENFLGLEGRVDAFGALTHPDTKKEPEAGVTFIPNRFFG